MIICPVLAFIESTAKRNPAPPFRSMSRSEGNILAAAFDKNGSRSSGSLLDGRVLLEFVDEAKGEKKRGIVWRDRIEYTSLTKDETVLLNWS